LLAQALLWGIQDDFTVRRPAVESGQQAGPITRCITKDQASGPGSSMGQLHADELPTTHANVDRLLHELQQLVRYVKPAEQWQDADSAAGQQSGIVVKGR
jgi:hypothetical protein